MPVKLEPPPAQPTTTSGYSPTSSICLIASRPNSLQARASELPHCPPPSTEQDSRTASLHATGKVNGVSWKALYAASRTHGVPIRISLALSPCPLASSNSAATLRASVESGSSETRRNAATNAPARFPHLAANLHQVAQ